MHRIIVLSHLKSYKDYIIQDVVIHFCKKYALSLNFFFWQQQISKRHPKLTRHPSNAALDTRSKNNPKLFFQISIGTYVKDGRKRESDQVDFAVFVSVNLEALFAQRAPRGALKRLPRAFLLLTRFRIRVGNLFVTYIKQIEKRFQEEV